MKRIDDWPKIINSRNPFTRLYSAWNDKSRSFPRYENGSIMYYGMDLNERFNNKVRVLYVAEIGRCQNFCRHISGLKALV